MKEEGHEVEKERSQPCGPSTSGFGPDTGLVMEGRFDAKSGSDLVFGHFNSKIATVFTIGGDFRPLPKGEDKSHGSARVFI